MTLPKSWLSWSLEAADWHLGARSYKAVASILAHRRESQPLPGDEPAEAPGLVHENVRGADYYH